MEWSSDSPRSVGASSVGWRSLSDSVGGASASSHRLHQVVRISHRLDRFVLGDLVSHNIIALFPFSSPFGVAR